MFLAAAAAPAVLLTVAACSSGNNNSGSSNSGNSNSAAASSAQPVGTEKATDNKFSVTSMTAKAGVAQTLNLSNGGQATHNWHVTDVKDDSGKDIKVDLIDGGKSESVTFTISKPGTYHFQCDAHPSDMKGTLVVGQ